MKRRDILLGASSLATAAVVANSQLSIAKQPDAQNVTPSGKNIQISSGLPGYYVTPVGTGKFPAVTLLNGGVWLESMVSEYLRQVGAVGFCCYRSRFLSRY